MAVKVIIKNEITEIKLIKDDIINLFQFFSIQLSDTFFEFDIITALWTFRRIFKSQK